MTFKIPFNAVSDSIYYTSENVTYGHYATITDKNFILDKLKIQIYDQNYNILNNNGLDWSFTLGFEFYPENE
jgi:hypothetical protein